MNGFFNFRKLVVGVMAATCFMGFQSCLDDDDDYPYSKVLPNALVTVKPVDDGSYFLQLDDSTTLLPVNMTSSPFGQKEVRALVNFDETNESSGIYSKAVNINWIDLWLRPCGDRERLGYHRRGRISDTPFQDDLGRPQ